MITIKTTAIITKIVKHPNRDKIRSSPGPRAAIILSIGPEWAILISFLLTNKYNRQNNYHGNNWHDTSEGYRQYDRK